MSYEALVGACLIVIVFELGSIASTLRAIEAQKSN